VITARRSTRLKVGANVGTKPNRKGRADPDRKKDVSGKTTRQRREPTLNGNLGRLEPYREKEASESKRQRRVPSPDNDSGRESYRRKKRKTNSRKTTDPKQGALRVSWPRSAAQRLSKDVAGPEQGVL
jgi:hypothetical protein